ncbi:MAG: alpha/beta hydrolase domain-containing protein, partial [Gemmatimonadota bacterium]|nr:alpha/beta hydrolase domain-containing protein [Gemmatimonadota bacterium]
GEKDLELPENVRIYLVSGTSHGRTQLKGGHPEEPGGDSGHYLPDNPNDQGLIEDPLFEKLARWVVFGEQPPASSYPRVDRSELVAMEDFSHPEVPDAEPPVVVPLHPRFDWGPGFRQGILDKPLPGIGVLYPVMVPEVDEDGNEVAGLRTPWVAVPLATYTGWNYPGHWLGVEKTPMSNLSGAWLPFCADRRERLRCADSRRSVAERYKNREVYLARVREYAEGLIARGLMFGEDMERLLRESLEMYDYVTASGAWEPEK